MIWIFLGISIVFIALGALFYKLDDYDCDVFLGVSICSFTVGIVGCIASLIAAIVFINSNVVVKTADSRIAMYEAENAKIEERVDAVVKGYQDYEKDTFAELSPDTDAMTLVYLYPELKSDALVQEQIALYVSNTERIRELKEEKIKGQVIKWWLYFGGQEASDGTETTAD